MKRSVSVFETIYWATVLVLLGWSLIDEMWFWHKVSALLQKTAGTIGKLGIAAENEYYAVVERNR